MAKQRLKQIRAGRYCRDILWTPVFPNDSPRERAEKAKITSAARRHINLRCAWQKLMLLLAANFIGTDLHITLGYSDEHLPPVREEARKRMRKFLQQLRAHRAARGDELRYVYVIESKHEAGRLHHHLVINATGQDYDLIRSLWIYGDNIEFVPVAEYGYDELAQYLTKEARDGPGGSVGARSWVPSLNLRRPVTPPAQWVPSNVKLEPPPNAYIISTEERHNEFGHYQYLEYIMPEPPAARRVRPKPKPKK